ncbi:MAG: hypothetical protein HY718_12020 [Planctomycetes bacterium]|nr:hypothetical protein [Planctomycetota bacterium]
MGAQRAAGVSDAGRGRREGSRAFAVRQFSPALARLLIIKGVCRAGPPIYILWSIVDWCRVDWRYAVAFGALTINYVIVFILTWTAPALMNGPWRVRAWQTPILAANAIALPILFHRTHGHLPWIFIAATGLCIASLYIGTAIHLRLHEKLPPDCLFTARGRPNSTGASGSPASNPLSQQTTS